MEAEELERLTEERRKQRVERKKKMAAGKKEVFSITIYKTIQCFNKTLEKIVWKHYWKTRK